MSNRLSLTVTADHRNSNPSVVRGARLQSRPATAFVLAGGAGLGAMQAGMVDALYERGIVPDLLVGTSAGALNAAYLASRPRTVATARALGQVWRGVHREDIFPIHPPTLIAGLANRGNYLVPGRRLRNLIARHLEFDRLQDAPTPVYVVTFDLLSGDEVRLSEGPGGDAVLAAASIPGVMPRWPGATACWSTAA